MVHRDLKPENVFLARGETGESPTVLDFGLAKFLPSSAEQTLDTDPGALVGTVRYMAPEQAAWSASRSGLGFVGAKRHGVRNVDGGAALRWLHNSGVLRLYIGRKFCPGE
jgi:hypothetical protein